MPRFWYSLAMYGVALLAPLYLLWRGRKQPEYRQHWGERYARYAQPIGPDDGTMRIWIHAVSVGETRAAQPLLNALRARYPAARIILTHMTPTGRATGAALYGGQVTSLYLPYDTPDAVHRFLDHVKPSLGIVMETELWPNLLAACSRRKIPVILANARLSAKSAAGYARLPRLAAQTLRALTRIGAQTSGDAQRLTQLGAADIRVTGNLKFDIEPPAEQLELGARMRLWWGERPVFLCASTREGEEELLLEAWRRMMPPIDAGGTAVQGPRPLLLLVPRHPQRFTAVANLAADKGFKVSLRSASIAVAPACDIVVGDSMGEMFAYYASVDLAFVGGSLLDFGCQNLIEPCATGTAVLIGHSTYNFAEAAAMALDCGAAAQINDANGLVDLAVSLLSDGDARQAMAKAGREFSAQHRGATAKTLELISECRPAAGAQSPLPS